MEFAECFSQDAAVCRTAEDVVLEMDLSPEGARE
jgi:hypothetical protein